MILYRMIKQSLKHIVLFIKLTIQIKKIFIKNARVMPGKYFQIFELPS